MTAGLKQCFNLISDREIEQIHQASLQILEKIGIRVEDPVVRKNLHDFGCSVEGERVRITPELIEKVISNIKKEISLSSRTGKRLDIRPGSVVSHSTGGIPGIIDLETGKKRNATLADVIKVTRLMDHLDQLDMPCALLYPHDVRSEISQIVQFAHLLRYTEKPVYGPGISSPGEAKYVAELFRTFAGSGKSLSRQPIGLVGISPESPLNFPKEITDTMQVIIGAGIPVVMLAAPVAGISGPFTIAGGIAQMNAEMLAFAAIAGTINQEAPLIYGSRLNFPNMKNGYSIWGIPDVGIGSAAASRMAARYGFLSDVYGLSCSACTFDNQAGYEKAVNSVLPLLAGANMISGFGSLANLMVASYEQLVIDNETFSILRKVKRGVEVNEDTLAVDIIARVVNGENFLEMEHTVRHLRGGEVFIPKLGFDRSWSDWETSGEKDLRMKAKEFVRQVLEKDEYPPFDTALEKEIEKILDCARSELVRQK